MILIFGKGLIYWTGIISLLLILSAALMGYYAKKKGKNYAFLGIMRKAILPFVLIHATLAILMVNFKIVI